MRGERTIDLGVAVRYPSGRGEYLEASTITIRAPGLSQFHVQTRMQAWVMEAMFSMAKRAASLKGVDEARKLAADEENEDKPAEEPSGVLVMDQAAIGLGEERFPEFALYVKKVLTNSLLATIGEDKARITDETWESIEAAAGTDGVMEVLGAFSAFFASARGSKKPNGNGSSTTSSSATKVPSLPSGPSKPRLKN